jgi:cytochrome c
MKKMIMASLLATGFLFAGAASAQSGEALLKSKGCLGCHDVDKKKVGPAFKDVAAKYKGKSDAVATITAELKNGKGHPVKVAASDAELKTLIEYVLAR